MNCLQLAWPVKCSFNAASASPLLRRVIAFWLAALACTAVATAAHGQERATAAKAPVPLEAFFGQVQIGEMALSPNGRWLASTVKSPEGRLRLQVADLEEKEPLRAIAAFSKLDINSVRWVTDEWLIFSTSDRNTYRLESGGGLFSVNRSGERLRQVIKRDWDSNFGSATGALEGNYGYLARAAVGAEEILVGEYRYVGGRLDFVNPIAVNVATGARRTIVSDAPANVTGWLFDVTGKPRAGISSREGKTKIYWRDEAAGPWRLLNESAWLESSFSLLAVKGDQLWVTHNDAQGFGNLSTVDVKTGKISDDSILRTPGFDSSIFSPSISRQTGDLLGVRVLTDARSSVWLEPQRQALQERIDQALSGRVNLILGCGPCGPASATLVFSYSDRDPGTYLLFHPKNSKLERLGQMRTQIESSRMTGLEMLRIKARDGADLPVWVTRPAGAKALPAVVLVHGGPNVRGREWDWDGEVQFLASLGYVVIEPEFRGSRGYGREHFKAGWKQWGKGMVDDMSDALSHAVKQGWVDGNRVCIAGASYGGYGTLMSLARYPNQYRCGVAWVGVTDQKMLFEVHWSDTSTELKAYSINQTVGDPIADAAMLAEYSPLNKAASIKAPVFMAYGRIDRRVPLIHGERMRDAMIKAGNAPEWVVYDEEGHGWRLPTTTMDFYKRMEAFLRKHNPPNN